MIDPLSPKWLNKRTIEVQDIVIYCARSIKPRNVTELKTGIHNITGADTSTVQRWFSHGIDHGKGKFLPNRFQAMVEFLFREKLITIEEIYSFSHKLGDIFEHELKKPWAQLLFYGHDFDSELPLKSDERYPKQFIHVHTSFLHAVEDKIIKESRNVIIIYGKPGSGKTTLVSQLEKSSKLAQIYGENILSAYLGGKNPEEYFRVWLRKISPILANTIYSSKDKNIPRYIKEGITKKDYLLLIDDISSVDYANKIMFLDLVKPNQSKIVITTSTKQVAKNLATLYDADLIDTPEFSLEETRQLFEIIVGNKINKNQDSLLSELRNILHGNPLGLYFSFKQLRDCSLERYIELINQFDMTIPRDLLKDVFLPLQITYERLDANKKIQFVRLGRLPILKNYSFGFIGLAFNSNESHSLIITEELIKKFNEETGVFFNMDFDEKTLEIHSQVILFAQSLNEKKIDGVDSLKRSIDQKIDQEVIHEIKRLSISEKLKVILGIKRPKKLMPHYGSCIAFLNQTGNMFFSPNKVTDWEILIQNLPFLSSTEYVFAYRLFLRERRQRYWIISMLISLIFAVRLFTEIILVQKLFNIELQNQFYFPPILLFLYSAVSCLAYSLVNLDNIFKWNWLFERMNIKSDFDKS